MEMGHPFLSQSRRDEICRLKPTGGSRTRECDLHLPSRFFSGEVYSYYPLKGMGI